MTCEQVLACLLITFWLSYLAGAFHIAQAYNGPTVLHPKVAEDDGGQKSHHQNPRTHEPLEGNAIVNLILFHLSTKQPAEKTGFWSGTNFENQSKAWICVKRLRGGKHSVEESPIKIKTQCTAGRLAGWSSSGHTLLFDASISQYLGSKNPWWKDPKKSVCVDPTAH